MPADRDREKSGLESIYIALDSAGITPRKNHPLDNDEIEVIGEEEFIRDGVPFHAFRDMGFDLGRVYTVVKTDLMGRKVAEESYVITGLFWDGHARARVKIFGGDDGS